MTFEVVRGPHAPSPLWNGKQLMSAYGPDREVARWVDSLNPAAGSLVFVAGDPLGLATRALVDRGCRAIALLPGHAARAWCPEPLETWAPEDGPLEDFLSEVFDTTGPEGVVWEVWPAFERLAPDLALEWSRRFRDHFRTVQGTWLTQRVFGRRFWTNAVRNLGDWENPASLAGGDRPVVIAASGPSLDDGLETLARNRHLFELWALPSSFETLARRGLLPDAGVATDGGFYAREHLHRLAGTEVPLLAALTSAPDRELSRRRVLFFSQGMPVERALLEAWGDPYPEVPSQGTVAVTALRLALEATTGPVFIAGLDLAFRDLRGHTSPHTVDRRLQAVHHRLQPLEGLWAQRLYDQAPSLVEGVRTSPALWTYALWLRSRAQFSRPVFRIAPSDLRWASMSEVSWSQAEALWKRQPGSTTLRWCDLPRADAGERRLRLRRALGALVHRTSQAPGDDPWVIDAARTAAPEALAQEFRSRRLGTPSTQVKEALVQYLNDLQESLR